MSCFPPQCKTCADFWVNEGRPMDHYLIVSRGGHIPGVHDQTRYGPVPSTAVVPRSCPVPRTEVVVVNQDGRSAQLESQVAILTARLRDLERREQESERRRQKQKQKQKQPSITITGTSTSGGVGAIGQVKNLNIYPKGQKEEEEDDDE